MAFKLFHLTRTDSIDYDQAAEMIVVATDIWAARRLAGKAARGEGEATWSSPNHSTCIEIGTAAPHLLPGDLLVDVLGA
jgi:hypothetical protein